MLWDLYCTFAFVTLQDCTKISADYGEIPEAHKLLLPDQNILFRLFPEGKSAALQKKHINDFGPAVSDNIYRNSKLTTNGSPVTLKPFP